MARTRKAKSRKAAQEFRERLRDYIRSQYQSNRRSFQRAVGLPASTVQSWFGKFPKLPDGSKLHQLGLNSRPPVSIDWLLFGDGVEIRGAATSSSSLAQTVLRYLAAALAEPTEGVSAQDVADYIAPDGAEQMLLEVVEMYGRRVAEARESERKANRAIILRAIRDAAKRADAAGDGAPPTVVVPPELVMKVGEVLHSLGPRSASDTADQTGSSLSAILRKLRENPAEAVSAAQQLTQVIARRPRFIIKPDLVHIGLRDVVQLDAEQAKRLGTDEVGIPVSVSRRDLILLLESKTPRQQDEILRRLQAKFGIAAEWATPEWRQRVLKAVFPDATGRQSSSEKNRVQRRR